MKSSVQPTSALLPDKVERQHQAVSESLVGQHDENIQVDRNGHRPEKRAGVREAGYRPLDDAVQRVGAENTPDSKGVGDGGQPVRHRQVDQELPRSRSQIRPDNVGENDQRRPQKRQCARAQNDHLLRKVHNCLIPSCHRFASLTSYDRGMDTSIIAVKQPAKFADAPPHSGLVCHRLRLEKRVFLP